VFSARENTPSDTERPACRQRISPEPKRELSLGKVQKRVSPAAKMTKKHATKSIQQKNMRPVARQNRKHRMRVAPDSNRIKQQLAWSFYSAYTFQTVFLYQHLNFIYQYTTTANFCQ